MKRYLLPALLTATIGVPPALASVSFSIDADRLATSAGTGVPEGALVLLVASTSNSDFAQLSVGDFSVGTFLGTSDDLVLWSGTASSYGAFEYPLLNAVTPGLNFANGWGQGDSLALMWFPSLNASSTTLTAGISYGLYTSSTASDWTSAWITPADGTSNYLLGLYTTDGTQLGPGESLSSLGIATNTVVPEPSTYSAVLGSLVLGVVGYRRFRKR